MQYFLVTVVTERICAFSFHIQYFIDLFLLEHSFNDLHDGRPPGQKLKYTLGLPQ